MLLRLEHPALSARDCRQCLKYQYDERSGEMIRKPDGRPMLRFSAPLCQRSIGCPKGVPGGGELSARNQRAYRHYLECVATGTFPDDPIVRRNAAIIRQAERVAWTSNNSRPSHG